MRREAQGPFIRFSNEVAFPPRKQAEETGLISVCKESNNEGTEVTSLGRDIYVSVTNKKKWQFSKELLCGWSPVFVHTYLHR